MIKYLEWDSAFFGIKIGRLESESGNDINSIESQLLQARKKDYNCLYLEIPISELTFGSELAAKGFLLVDLKTTLSKSQLKAFKLSSSVRDDEQEHHRPFLESIASQISSMSRFSIDENFSRKSQELYRIWAVKSFFEAYSDYSFYYLQDNRPVGFTTMRIKDGVPFIELFGVDELYRRIGIGAELLKASETWAVDQGFTELRVVTQGRNLPALQLYQRNGFVTSKVTLFYHKWI